MTSNSLKKNNKGIWLMLLSSFMVCFGQLLWKLSVDSNIYYILGGFFLYGIGAISMIIAYKFGSLSVLQPMLSVNYILSILIGHFVLGEQISCINILGVIFIICGVILIVKGD